MSAILFNHVIGPVRITCLVSESHKSDLEITNNPIETGAEVNDHAVVKPKEVTLDIGDVNAAATYMTLMKFQETRVPFTMVTGLNVYTNMLIQSLSADRDPTFSKVLRATITLREVIIVPTGSAPDDGGASSKGKAGGKKSTTATKPDSSTANNAQTADRSASAVQSGDNATATASPKNESLIHGMLK